MFFKREKSLFDEVDSSRHVVYDFRRRTKKLFESYRMVSYKKRAEYNLALLMEADAEILGKLVAANALDAGNKDCLVERILGTVRDGMCYLDHQLLDHLDFYKRQEGNMAVHSADIGEILKFWEEKKNQLIKRHNHTQELWDKYYGNNQKEEKNEK